LILAIVFFVYQFNPGLFDVNSFGQNINFANNNSVVDSNVVFVGNNYSVGDFNVANWNLQIFGVSKSSDLELMDYYVEKISFHDIVFIQEIRDASGDAFRKLCDLSVKHDCLVSHRSGRSSSKEQYGFMFSDRVEVLEVRDFANVRQADFERPPYAVKVRVGGLEFWLVNLHAKPDDVYRELVFLEELVGELEGLVLVLGDLNASCSYFNRDKTPVFVDWVWVIGDSVKTNVAEKSSCAYDRIIVELDLNSSIKGFGVMDDVLKEQSDHYLVWVTLGS